MKQTLIVLMMILPLLLTACGTTDAGNPDSSNTGENTTAPTTTTAPSAAVTSATEPPATQPPATEPPATDPPATQPPATEPPATEPPATQPPATEPPATEPPVTQPPETEPPATEPPVTQPPETEPPATEPPATQPPETEPPTTQPSAPVEVTLPAFMFEGEDMTSFDADAYATENGLISAIVNDDGSVTITLTQDRYQEILDESSAQFDLEFAELASNTSYITGITRNEDFSQITVTVVREEYENAFDMTHISVGFIASYYQGLLGREPHVEILFVDDVTGDTVFSCVFPDILSES